MNMNKTFKSLFGPVRAEEELKNRTLAFLAKETRGYTGAGAGSRKYSLYAAACACLLFLLLGGRWLYFTPTVRISIDINPSIEMSINRFDRVIMVDGLNEDGRALSDALDIQYMNYSDAVQEVFTNDAITALLSGNEVMAITVIGPDGRQSAGILSGIEAHAAGHHNTYCYFTPPGEVAAAHETGLSCGKYRAFLELRLLDPDITPEAVREMTMREILDRTGCLSAGEDGSSPSCGNSGAGGHSHGAGYGHRWRKGQPE